MRILKPKKTIKLPDESVKRFFAQAWYSLIHDKSLDSHRVRCMNPLNIARELQGLIAKQGRLQKIEKDIALVYNEMFNIIMCDYVINRHFQNHQERLKSCIENQEIRNPKNKNIKNNIFNYFLKDFIDDLNKNYKKYLIIDLEKAIFENHAKGEVFDLTRMLLSILIDEGRSIGALFSLVENILCCDDGTNFQDRFNKLKNILVRTEVSYELIFRLTDFSRFDNKKLSEVGGVFFKKELKINTDNNEIKKFTKPGLNVVFSQTKAQGLDVQAAGLRAKQKIDNILDLIRFELEDNVINMDERFIAKKDNAPDIIIISRLPSRIPNPSRNLKNEEFQAFLENAKHALEEAKINEESKNKITSAFRFYRMGRDTPQYENKFINWWTALEYLLRTGDEGSIIAEIEKKLSSALLLEYMVKHLKSYISACAYCGAAIPEGWISPSDFFNHIHNDDKWDSLKKQIKEYPFLIFSLEKFKQQTKDCTQILQFLDTHENHLKWHINRLWRMRCDIVHSAEHSINITLLSANLEYYLKTVLSMVLAYLRANPLIENLNELFIRIVYSADILKNSLKENNDKFYKNCLNNIII